MGVSLVQSAVQSVVQRARQSISESVARSMGSSERPHRSGPDLPPGPTSPAALQLAAFLYEPQYFLKALRETHGEIVTLRLPGMFNIVQVSQPEHVKEMFRVRSDVAGAGKANAILKPFLGPHSLLMLDGKRHMRHRRLMMPPFRGERMRAYESEIRAVTHKALKRFPTGEIFKLQPRNQDITLDVIMSTVFGIAEPGPLRSLLQRALRMLDNPLYILEYVQKDLGPLSPWGRYLRLRREIQSALMSHIEASRQDPQIETRHDILSMLLLARDEDGEPLSDDEVHDELITMLIAGHETTATALSWTVHRLTRHPEVLARALAEVDASGDEDGAALPYLDAVIRESLRIHPVVPGVGRVLEKPFTLAGYDLPAGTMIGCSIILAHTNENVWPNAESFKPERFLEHRPPPDTYFPFGGGVRRCIGEAFALFEMRVVLRELLRTFTPEASGESIRSVRRNITLSPSGSMPVIFRRR